MKHIVSFLAILLHIVCNADYVTVAQPKQSWNAITSDNSAKIDCQSNYSTRTVYVSHPISFSTQHRSFRHHSPTPRYNLNHMNTEQLVRYFSTHDYTESEILSHPMLYMNQAYLALAKQLPRYPEFVEKYYKRYRTYKGLYKFWETINFRYRKGMKKRFAQLYQECDTQRIAKEVRVRTEREDQAKKEAAIAYYTKLDSLTHDLTLDAVPHHHQQEREKACAQIKASPPDRSITRKYTVTQHTVTFAHAYGITERDLASLQGNAYEHQLHTEFLEQLTEANTVSTSYALQPKNILIDALGHGVAIGMEANRLQQPGVATAWANLSWKVLDIIEGVGEGLMLFAENTADMILHPIHTLQQTVHCLGMLTGLIARTCARTASATLYWHELMEHGDGLMMAQEMDQVAYKIAALGYYCKEKAASLEARDVVKYGTVIAADVILTHKMFTLGGTLCTRASLIIRDAMAHVSNRVTGVGKIITNTLEAVCTESPVLQTAEGVLMKASEGLNKAGGTAVDAIKDARLALEVIHAEYMASLKTELETLRLLCNDKIKGFTECANKWLKIDYEHILGIEVIFDRRGYPKVCGFHHDLMGALEKSGTIQFANKKLYTAGFYKADLIIDGTKVTKTFFPSEWPREKVINKIYEACSNCINSGILPELGSDGKYVIQSCISEGVELKICITQKGRILTAYPILT